VSPESAGAESEDTWDDEDRSLSALFSGRGLSAAFELVWIMALVLLVFWPDRDIGPYLKRQSPPLVCLGTFVSAALMLAYVNFRWGAGEFARLDPFAAFEKTRRLFYEETRPFLLCGLPRFAGHVLFLTGLCLPLFIASAGVCGVTPPVFARCLSVVMGASLVARLLGCVLQLWLSGHLWLKYYLGRLLLIVFLFAADLAVPGVSPVFSLYSLQRDGAGYGRHMMLQGGALILLTLAAHITVAHRCRKKGSS